MPVRKRSLSRAAIAVGLVERVATMVEAGCAVSPEVAERVAEDIITVLIGRSANQSDVRLVVTTDKERARRLVRTALLKGNLVRPDKCEECGNRSLRCDGRAAIQAHHHLGHDRPLDVRWLCPRCHTKYDSHPSNNKLSNDQVLEIRNIYVKRHPELSGPALALRYGVSPSAIHQVVSGRSWRTAV